MQVDETAEVLLLGLEFLFGMLRSLLPSFFQFEQR